MKALTMNSMAKTPQAKKESIEYAKKGLMSNIKSSICKRHIFHPPYSSITLLARCVSDCCRLKWQAGMSLV